jgi:hypothetical protein
MRTGAAPIRHRVPKMHITRIPAFVLLLVIPLCVLIGGCCTPPATRHVYLGYDTSGSARPYLGAYALLSSQLAGRLAEQRDVLTLYRLDSRLCEFSDGSVSGGRAELLRTLHAELGKPSERKGTFPALFWAEVARRAHTEPQDTWIILFSDGDNDGPGDDSMQSLRTAVRQLAATPTVTHVIICGAEPRNWATLREAFSPLGSRFQLFSASQMQIEPLLQSLNASPKQRKQVTLR